MREIAQQVAEAASFLKERTKVRPKLGIILGTGLGGLVKKIRISDTISYEEIPHFPISTVESHAGRLILGALSGKPVMVMQGRFHFYEGYSLQQVTFPVRVMKELGIRTMIISNACGGVNPVYRAGDIMIMSDHINLMGANPLIGKNDKALGPRFPDMCNAYDRDLIALTEQVALDEKIKVQKGVYLALSGPNLETAAEYRMCRYLGADVVGMSTVPEVIVARHAGIKALGFSIVTDMGLADALKPASLEHILKVAAGAEPKFVRLVTKIVQELTV
ncbi:MAG: purine-nucleoside phosphorylase [Candidatus Edwardsbacteria bacterium]|nr:purine-nucleoside phosphorylase [Candidatus Edwardsbacteria bacterium]